MGWRHGATRAGNKRGIFGIMKDQNQVPSSETPDQKETPSRRELIEKYGKYALVGAPLLIFVSKAHAIHSKP